MAVSGVTGMWLSAGPVRETVEGLLLELLLPNQPNAGLREAFRAAGRDTIETRYSFTTRMQRLAGLYDQLLTGDRLP